MPLIWLTLSWLGGLWLAATFEGAFPIYVWGAAAAIALLTSWLTRHFPYLSLAFACMMLVALAGTRFQLAQPTLDANHISYYNGREIELNGLVVEEPDIRDRYINLRVAAQSLTLGGETYAVTGTVLVQTPRFPIIPYGAQLLIHGRLEEPPIVPEFDYRGYLEGQGILSVINWPRIEIEAENQGNWLKHKIYLFKERAQHVINSLIPEPEAALLSGILLGADHAMPPALVNDFRTTGITHIVVISGFNISILAALFLRIGDPLLGKRWAAAFTIAAIILYTIMVGAEPAVVRAAIMGTLYVVANRYLGRPSAAVGSLLLAAIIMTALDPFALWDIGFQLSFAATLSLLLYADPLSAWTRAHLYRRLARPTADRILNLISESVLVTLAAQVLVLPLLMFYFQQLSLVSLLANAFILPVQPAIMVLGGLATLLGLVALPLAQPLGWTAYLFLLYTTKLARLFAQIPYALVEVPLNSTWLLTIYVIIGALTWYATQDIELRALIRYLAHQNLLERIALGGTVAAFLLTWQWQATQPDGLLHVTFFDVGQGDAIFIQTPTGRQILVDGGLYPSVLNEHLGRTLPFWDRTLDIVVATHPDADHVSGLPGAFERYRVDRLLVSDEQQGEAAVYDAVLAAAETQNTTIQRALTGQRITFSDGVQLQILHPGLQLSQEVRNNNSVALRVEFGHFTLLLTGDAEAEAETEMLATGLPLQSLVFKAGHHGANNASGLPLLTAVRPQVVIISAGENNRFGHPHPEMLARAAAMGATILRTDIQGTIALTTDGTQIWWQAGPKR